MTLAARRLDHQQLASPRFDEPADVVRWLGAVQAQDLAASRWAVGVGLAGADEAAIERAHASTISQDVAVSAGTRA